MSRILAVLLISAVAFLTLGNASGSRNRAENDLLISSRLDSHAPHRLACPSSPALSRGLDCASSTSRSSSHAEAESMELSKDYGYYSSYAHPTAPLSHLLRKAILIMFLLVPFTLWDAQ